MGREVARAEYLMEGSIRIAQPTRNHVELPAVMQQELLLALEGVARLKRFAQQPGNENKLD